MMPILTIDCQSCHESGDHQREQKRRTQSSVGTRLLRCAYCRTSPPCDTTVSSSPSSYPPGIDKHLLHCVSLDPRAGNGREQAAQDRVTSSRHGDDCDSWSYSCGALFFPASTTHSRQRLMVSEERQPVSRPWKRGPESSQFIPLFIFSAHNFFPLSMFD